MSVWQAVRARRVKVYSTLYDDTKGFVGSRRPASFDNAESLLVSVLQAKETVEDLVKRRLRCTHASRYGWREEFTLLEFKGGSEKLLAMAVALTSTLSQAMRVTSVDIAVEGCVGRAQLQPCKHPLHLPSPARTSCPANTRSTALLSPARARVRLHRWLDACHEAASDAYRYMHEIAMRQRWTAAVKRAPMPLTLADSIILGGKVRPRPRRHVLAAATAATPTAATMK